MGEVKMRGPKDESLTLAAAFSFLLYSISCQLIEAKPTNSLAEQSSKSDLLLLLDPAEEFISDVLEDFRSRLSDGFPEYGLPSLDPLQVPKMAFNLSSDMFEVNFSTSSNLNLTNLANFTTDLIHLDLDTSEIKMNVSKMRVDGELFLDGMVLDIFPIYGDGLFWIEIYGVTLAAQSDVNINGKGFIQASNLNVSAQYSELDMQFYQCNFCPNGEVVEDLLHLIGTNIWTEAEQLLVDFLQQAMHNILSEAFQRCSADEIINDGQC